MPARMERIACWWWLLLGVVTTFTTTTTAAEPMVVLECRDLVDPSRMLQLPSSRVNDGYCDCGIDEPKTGACAGSTTWAGLAMSPSQDEDASSSSSSARFQCPQQPRLLVPASHVQDGICDCCDGADELPGVCHDDCDAILAEERERQERQRAAFATGHQLRLQQLEEYQTLRTTNLAQHANLETDLHEWHHKLDDLQDTQYPRALELWWKGRQQAWQDVFQRVPVEQPDHVLLDPTVLTADQLVSWILHACQMAGEMARSGSKSCVPLRLAGLDVGVWWEPSTYILKRAVDAAPNPTQTLARLIDHNLRNQDSLIWHPSRLPSESSSSKKSNNRRRLDEIYDDDYMYDEEDEYRRRMYDEDDDYMMEEDDYGDEDIDDNHDDEEDEDPYERDRQRRHSRPQHRTIKPKHQVNKESSTPEETEEEKRVREELLQAVQQELFAQSRLVVLGKLDRLLNKLEGLAAEAKPAEEEEEAKAAEGENDETSAAPEAESSEPADGEQEQQTPPLFDPMALPMTTSELQNRKDTIQRGFDYAVSALVLVRKIAESSLTPEQQLEILQGLALAILNHGQLSAQHVWQLYRAVIPDLADAAGDDVSSQTCVAPWARACPPKQSVGGPASVLLPPNRVLQIAMEYCNKPSDEASVAAACADPSEIPSHVPDGYLGYFALQHRSPGDPVGQMFAAVNRDFGGKTTPGGLTPERQEVTRLEREISRAESVLKDLRDEQKQLLDAIGGLDGPGKFGPDGELFSLQNKCLDITANKYVYELCIFKSAKQKEGGSGGTQLGNWVGADVDEETGLRVWRWEKGTRCWNGPDRSASAFVTCGPENKVIAADEPETCRYVFNVESPIACDENFRIMNNL